MATNLDSFRGIRLLLHQEPIAGYCIRFWLKVDCPVTLEQFEDAVGKHMVEQHHLYQKYRTDEVACWEYLACYNEWLIWQHFESVVEELGLWCEADIEGKYRPRPRL